jgi:hypothetical protein
MKKAKLLMLSTILMCTIYANAQDSAYTIKYTKAHVRIITDRLSLFNSILDKYTAKQIDYYNVAYIGPDRHPRWTIYLPIELKDDIKEFLDGLQK